MSSNDKIISLYMEFMNKYSHGKYPDGSHPEELSSFMTEVKLNTDKGIIFKQIIREFARLAEQIPEHDRLIMGQAERMIDIIFREYTYCAEWSEDERNEARQLPPSKWVDEIKERQKTKQPRINSNLEECDEWKD